MRINAGIHQRVRRRRARRAAHASYWLLRDDRARSYKGIAVTETASAALARKQEAGARRILGDIAMAGGNREVALELYLAGPTVMGAVPLSGQIESSSAARRFLESGREKLGG